MASTWRRCEASGWCERRPMSVPPTSRPAFGGNCLETAAVALEHGDLAGERLPALDGNIDVWREEFDGMACTAGDLGRNDGGAGAGERLVDGLTGRGIVLDRPLHAF